MLIITNPAEADTYARNYRIRSRKHAILICHVITNKPQRLEAPEQWRTKPSKGYNCVRVSRSL